MGENKQGNRMFEQARKTHDLLLCHAERIANYTRNKHKVNLEIVPQGLFHAVSFGTNAIRSTRCVIFHYYEEDSIIGSGELIIEEKYAEEYFNELLLNPNEVLDEFD